MKLCISGEYDTSQLMTILGLKLSYDTDNDIVDLLMEAEDES